MEIVLTQKHVMILCPSCTGLGYRVESICTDYHKREYDEVHHPCKMCDSKGRIWEVTTVDYKKLP